MSGRKNVTKAEIQINAMLSPRTFSKLCLMAKVKVITLSDTVQNVLKEIFNEILVLEDG